MRNFVMVLSALAILGVVVPAFAGETCTTTCTGGGENQMPRQCVKTCK